MESRDEKQYAHILALRNDLKVLDEHQPAGLPEDAVMVAISCADGHRIKDIFDHHHDTQKCNIHLLALNAGALLLSEACPENNDFPWAQGLRQMVLKSCAIKKTKFVALGSHWPCAVAMEHGLSVDDVLTMTLHARLKLKELDPTLQVYCFFHVAHLDGRPRTYSIAHKHEYFGDMVLLTTSA